MAGTIIDMSKIKQLLHLKKAGVSNRQIAKDLKMSRDHLGYPDFFQSALVCDSILLAVLDYLCDFFSCKHLFLVRSYLAWNKFAIRTSPVAYD